jgi:hypothetical protein
VEDERPPLLAGPWYTPQELKALNAYSHASFQKKALLAGANAAPTTANGGTVALAGPRLYTARA